MELITAQCPYCSHKVEAPITRTAQPIRCPKCDSPFQVEMPVAKVISVREVDSVDEAKHLGSVQKEVTLHQVHPVIFRARPLATLGLLIVACAVGVGLYIALTGDTILGSTSAGNGTNGIPSGEQEPIGWLLWLSTAGAVAVLLTLGSWYLISRATKLVVTDVRILYQKGIIQRETSEVQHDDVRNIQLEQSIFQRLMGIGDIAISSAGQDEMEIVARQLPSPAAIVKTIREHQR